MKNAVEIQSVYKFFTDWKKKPTNGNRWSRIFALLRWEKKRKYAVNGVSLEIKQGEIFGVLGTNGSGKSTLIRLISTLLIPDGGSINVFGLDVGRDELKVRQYINRVSVEAAFFKKLSPWENLSYSCRLYGYCPEQIRPRIMELFEYLELSEEKLYEPMENMSRGMQQKVAIARALLTAPSLLLLDEPTTGLDPRSKKQVQEFISRINREKGITTLLTTHDMEEADKLCARLAIMKDGRIIAEGTPESLKKGLKNGNSDKAATLEEVFLKLAEEGS